MAVIFMESKHILSKDMTNAVDKYFFTCLPIAKEEKNLIKKVVLSMYKDNMQIKRERDLSAFHKVNPSLLLFINTVGYRRCLVLAYFVNNDIF